MTPLFLSIRDFMNHNKSEIDFTNFNTALIVGKTKNDDAISNGVGKSTVFSAIEWVLFNKVHKTTLDKVVRDGKTKCSVDFDFEIEGTKYRISRTLSSKGTKNVYLYELLNDQWESITQRTPTETENKIQEIIKISHKAFQYSILFRQADLSGLAEAENGAETNSKSRIDILKEPMNLSRYSKKEKIGQELIKPIKADIARKESALEILGDPEKDVADSKKDLASCKKQLEEKERVIKNDIQVNLDEKKRSWDALKATLSGTDADIHNKVEDKHKEVKGLNRAIKELDEDLKKAVAQNTAQKLSLKEKKNSLIELTNKQSVLEAQVHRAVSIIRSEYEKTAADEVNGNVLLTRAQVELEHAQKSIPETDACPACKQPITSEYRCAFEDEVQKILDSKNKDIVFYTEALTKCRRKRDRLSKELDAAKAHTNELSNLNQKILSTKENIETYDKNILSIEESILRIEGAIHTRSLELQEAMSQYNTLKELSEKSNLSELNTKIFSLAREVKIYEQSLESMRTEVQSLKTREGILEDRIISRTNDLDKTSVLRDDLAKLRKDLAIHQRVVNAFSHKGIPTSIINTCLNELQLETNKVLQELRPDLEVQFDADLNFTYRRNGFLRDYQQLSHGQHVYIALAFKRGLAKVIQRKMGVSLNYLCFDEVDSALDEAGVNALATAIKKWEKDFKILVITHNKQLKDKFSHAILVEEGDNGSEANVVTSW